MEVLVCGHSSSPRSLFNNDVTARLIYWMRTGRGLLHLCVLACQSGAPPGDFF